VPSPAASETGAAAPVIRAGPAEAVSTSKDRLRAAAAAITMRVVDIENLSIGSSRTFLGKTLYGKVFHVYMILIIRRTLQTLMICEEIIGRNYLYILENLDISEEIIYNYFTIPEMIQ
jgi:hypothetical protein